MKINTNTLMMRQAYPLELKVGLTESRIHHWYCKYAGDVYVAFSGGKDSTALLHMVRTLYPDVPAVFVNTGLEYPEILKFVQSTENVTILRPGMSFRQVLQKHGYPVISKAVARAVARIRSPGTSERSKLKTLYGDERGSYGKLPKCWRFLLDAPFKISDRCCEVMKIRPITKYHKETGRSGFVGTMAADSNARNMQYRKHGCYLDHLSTPRCTPMAFWKDVDVWEYLRTKNVPYCKVYDTGVQRTGCVFCAFGIMHEGRPNRFDLLKETHPKLYTYCMETLKMKEVLPYLGLSVSPINNTLLEEQA